MNLDYIYHYYLITRSRWIHQDIDIINFDNFPVEIGDFHWLQPHQSQIHRQAQ